MRLITTRRRSRAVVVALAALLALGPAAPTPAASTAATAPPPIVVDLLPATSPPGANDFTCKPTAAHPAPVVLVHGTFEGATDNGSTVSPQIEAAGYCVFALEYGNRGTGDIPTSAGQLARFVDAVLAATGAKKVSLVGHSQGGMMPRWYMRFLGGATKVDDLVGLARSNHGTTNPGAFVAGATFGPACDQQRAGSAFLQKRNAGAETRGNVSLATVAEFVESATIAEALRDPGAECGRGFPPRAAGPGVCRLHRSCEPWFTSTWMPYRPTERTEARRVATRERVVAAARELIARGGYREAQVATVAARAGVATGTVYRHFPSKADLFAEVFRQVSRRELDATRAAADAVGNGPATARLRAAIETFARRALRARRQAWALLAEAVDPAVEAERLAFRRAHAAHFAAILRDGIAAGELPAMNADLAAAALVGALGEALVGPLSPVAPRADPDALVDELVAFCLRSVTDRQDAHVDVRP